MARTTGFTEDELQKALRLRDEALTAEELHKAMSVILSAKLGLDAIRVSELLGTSRSTIFRKCREIRKQYDSSKKPWGGRRSSSLTLDE